MNATVTILGMALITFIVKALVFLLGDRVRFPAWLERALGFIPVTVLTAIIVPMILAPHGHELELNLHNPQLIASIFAIVICAATRKQLLTIIAGLVVFFGWQVWM